jgi:proteasome lid subunit RPN8/RPN11
VLEREERRGDVVGFLHTHPGMSAHPSRRDIGTTRAWTSALGMPLLCVIDGEDGLLGWRFDDDGPEGVRLLAVEAFPRGIIIGVDHHGR